MIRITDEQGRWLQEILNRVPDGGPDEVIIGDLTQLLSSQLANANHFNDLIDTVVAVVSEPRITTLGRDALSLLRKAILSPIELARFNVQVSKGQECNRCGMELGSYEAVSLRDRQIYCHQCAHPEVITCQTCHERLDASGLMKSIQRLFGRHQCPGTVQISPDIVSGTRRNGRDILSVGQIGAARTQTWSTSGAGGVVSLSNRTLPPPTPSLWVEEYLPSPPLTEDEG